MFEQVKHKQRSKKSAPNQCSNPNINKCQPYAIYSKGLCHNENGFVDICLFNQYYCALVKKSISKLNCIPHNDILQCDPISAWSYDEPEVDSCEKLPLIDSPKYATNLIELYAMAYSRDVPFCNYASDVKISKAIEYLKELSYTKCLPCLFPQTIFKGTGCGVNYGPYISQFLYSDFLDGNTLLEQKYTFYEPEDFMKTLVDTVSVQNGIVNEELVELLSNKYITNGRELAYYVKMFEPFQIAQRTVSVLNALNVPQNKCLPCNNSNSPFVNYGFADVISSLGAIIRPSLLAAWCFKNRTLFVRPEVGSLIVERTRLDIQSGDNPKISEEILNNPILAEFLTINGNHLLPQVYPEGSPLTPAFPSYYGVLAGAIITVLKFFFDCSVILNLYKPDETGSNLVDSGLESDVYSELNKLAANLALGRSWAGINYRFSGKLGIQLGEKIALCYLQKHVQNYPQTVKVYIKLYDGHVATVNN